ncbi:TMV resistance protein N-like [Senna tora]|uniref:TMV resistance protein N-like n=1 Tax=Senna tora TaxID=362788 RepID=A0A835CJZ6_9FABA|nr:TMV resistance protein N-like [Senna tora]
MGVCNTVDILKERILKGWNYGGFDDSLLPGDQYPDWFIYKGEGCSVFFKVPQVMGYCLKGMILNIVHSSCIDNMISQFVINVLIVNHTKGTLQLHKRDSMTCQEDEEWQAILSSIAPADEVTLSIGCQITINKIVAYLVYQDSGIALM